jgi:hypothetical protein
MKKMITGKWSKTKKYAKNLMKIEKTLILGIRTRHFKVQSLES